MYIKMGMNCIILLIFGTIITDSSPLYTWQDENELLLYYLPYNIHTVVPESAVTLENWTGKHIRQYHLEKERFASLIHILNYVEQQTPVKRRSYVDFSTGNIEETDMTSFSINARIAIVYKNKGNTIFSIGIGTSIQYFSYNESVFTYNEELMGLFHRFIKECNIPDVTRDFSQNFNLRDN